MIAGDRDAVSSPLGSGLVLAIAFAYYAVASVLLVVDGVSLATLHAFAAFVTLAIVAVSNQLVPVLTGIPPTPPREVIAASLPIAAGFALLILGFTGFPTFVAAAVLLAIGIIGWVAWLIARMARAQREKTIAGVFSLALVAFVAAALIGTGIAATLGTSHVSALLLLAPVHAALAVGAFAGTLIVTVGYRLVPMFSLGHAAEGEFERFPQWVVPVAALGGGALYSAFAMVSLRIAAAIVFCCLSFAAFTHLRSLRSRMRRRLDASIRYAAVAWVFGLISAALFALAGSSPSIAVAAIVCAVLGWLSISILGYAYKIAGFLAWETAKGRFPNAALPPLSKALPERTATIALCLLGAGTAVTAGLALTSLPIIFGGTIYALGAASGIGVLFVLIKAFLWGPHVAYSTR